MDSANSQDTIQRVYRGIKDKVISYSYRPGERLSIEALADDHRVSTTPVREILNRLAAEDFIDMIPKVGFFMKSMTESEVRDLYELQEVLLSWSVESIRKLAMGVDPYLGDVTLGKISILSDGVSPKKILKFTNGFFIHLAEQSGNDEVVIRVKNIVDRLHCIQLIDCGVNDQSAIDVLRLCELYNDSKFGDLLIVIAQYFESRENRLVGCCKVMRKSQQLSSNSVTPGREVYTGSEIPNR